MNEFLAAPRWRTRVGRGRRGVAIAATFTAGVAVGVVAMVLVITVLDRLGAQNWVLLAAWVVPTLMGGGWGMRTRVAATVSEMEAQSWSDYVVRFVMVGGERPRPGPQRLVTAIAFGAPVAYLAVLGAALELLGLA